MIVADSAIITSLPLTFRLFEAEEWITLTTVEEASSKDVSDAVDVGDGTTLIFYYLFRDNESLIMSMTEFMDPTAAKVVLAANRGDSINRIAEKIGISYSWVYDWIERLEDKDIIANTDNGIHVIDHELRQRYAEMMAALYSRDTITKEDAYTIPHFAGMEFAYTEIDAAYVWTHGGYQIARSHDDYPVFIEVHDQDIERWIAFFEQFGIGTAINERPEASEIEGDVYYILYPTTDGIDMDWVDGNPVISLERAVDQMLENRPAYEPALEIIAEEQDIDLDVEHHSKPSSGSDRSM